MKAAIRQELEATLRPICQYEEAVKVIATFTHRGATHFRDWSLSLGPVAAIKAGKPVLLRQTFQPGDREEMELVVSGTKLEAIVSATVDDQRSEYPHELTVEAPQAPESKRFRFLEPTRLAQDKLRVFRLVGDDKMYAEKRQEAFLLCGGDRYLVEIEPQQSGVREVKLNGLGHEVQVLKSERKGDLWTFTIDIATLKVFRKRERLYFEVFTSATKLTGEVQICLTPHWTRHLGLALTACALVSFPGAAGLLKWIAHADYSLAEIVTSFTWEHVVFLGMTISTLFLWWLIKLTDGLQYRLLR